MAPFSIILVGEFCVTIYISSLLSIMEDTADFRYYTVLLYNTIKSIAN